MRYRRQCPRRPLRLRLTRRRRRGKHTGLRCTQWAALLLTVILLLCRLLELRFDPILDELAEYEARAAVAQAVEAAAQRHARQNAGAYAGLYALQTDAAGQVLSVTADTAAMNAVRLSLAAAVNAALKAMPAQKLHVPFGTLTGFSLLNSLGPGWPLSLQPEGYAESELEESAESVAVNRVRYTAAVRLHITVNMVLDGKNRVLYLDSRIPLASVLVSGEIPLYYGAGG